MNLTPGQQQIALDALQSFAVNAALNRAAARGVTMEQMLEAINAAGAARPIDMVLYCPNCGAQHIDAPEKATKTHADRGCGHCGGTGQTCDFPTCLNLWSNPPHRSHLCHKCACIWRPADVPTNGVASIKTEGKADTWPAEHNEEIRAQGVTRA
jgi:predicted RNA-binding Zn-ribbon protein involved in translation (DUF1610 family)